MLGQVQSFDFLLRRNTQSDHCVHNFQDDERTHNRERDGDPTPTS